MTATKKIWKSLIDKQLKKQNSFDNMSWQTQEGVKISPFYTQEDRTETLSHRRKTHPWFAVGDYFDSPDSWHIEAVKLRKGEKPDRENQVLFAEDVSDWKTFSKRKNPCFLLNDPLVNIAKKGNFIHENRSSTFQYIKDNILLQANGQKGLMIDTSLYQNAGANVVNQLALALLELKEYLENLGKGAASQIFFRVAIGNHFFLESAKLSVLRNLSKKIFNAFDKDEPIFVFAENSMRNKSIMDLENNLVRTTLEATAAILGGANAIYLNAFDKLIEESSFAREAAYKQLLILKEESHLQMFSLPMEGNYFLSNLEKQLSDKAWKKVFGMGRKWWLSRFTF